MRRYLFWLVAGIAIEAWAIPVSAQRAERQGIAPTQQQVYSRSPGSFADTARREDLVLSRHVLSGAVIGGIAGALIAAATFSRAPAEARLAPVFVIPAVGGIVIGAAVGALTYICRVNRDC